MHPPRNRQRGAALVVGLILLAVLTLLAISGMNTASTELVMAGNEQYRQQAFQASETGIERELLILSDIAPGSGPVKKDIDLGSNAKLNVLITYRGEGSVQNHSTNFVGFHYDVRSNGTSSRNASALHWQGAYYVNQVGTDGTQRPMTLLGTELK
jgi:type IV pilus assembly protein PilX